MFVEIIFVKKVNLVLIVILIAETLFAEIGKRIIGQKEVVRNVWATIIARGHCLMIGVPGLAKTYLVTTFSDALGLNFKPTPESVFKVNYLRNWNTDRNNVQAIGAGVLVSVATYF